MHLPHAHAHARALSTLGLAFALGLAGGCSFSPSVSDLQPKLAGDCPGQKACGYRCLDQDDPIAGCTSTSCQPCPAAPAHAAPTCGADFACGYACLPGWGDCGGGAADGCETPLLADAANCGACGRACGAGVACVDGACGGATPSTLVPSTGAAPRGLAVSGDLVAWAIDPPVQGGVRPLGELRWTLASSLSTTGAVTDLGHPTWVRASGGRWLAAATVDPDGFTAVPLYDTQAGAPFVKVANGGHDAPPNVVSGLALTPDWVFSAEAPWDVAWSEPYGDNTSGSGINIQIADATNLPEGLAALYGVGEGAGRLWLGHGVGVSRLEVTPDWGYEVVAGGGVYFEALAARPEPSRIAARSGPTPADPVEVYFADLTDGSIWMGLTTGAGNAPWRIVRGDGPRTQLDLVGDEQGAYWSDLDRGEIWAIERGGAVRRVATGVRPWALALDAGRIYWTDVDARQVRSLPR